MLTWNKAYAAGSNYVKPIHSFAWAKGLALEGWHLETPMLALFGWRMIFYNRGLTLAKFDKYGQITEVADIEDQDLKSNNWRLWADNGKLIKEEQ